MRFLRSAASARAAAVFHSGNRPIVNRRSRPPRVRKYKMKDLAPAAVTRQPKPFTS